MATRAQMREWLRRRLNETTADQWSDSALNDYLNQGLVMVQDEIEKVDDEAFVYEDVANTVVAQQKYPFPTNMKKVLKLEYKASSSADYVELDQISSWRKIEDPDINQATLVYAMYGRYLYIKPEPTVAVTQGLRLTYVPVLAMGSDSDVPDVVSDLHIAIVLFAQLVAFGDSSGATARTEVKEDLLYHLNRIATTYGRNSGGAEQFTVADHVKLTELG